MTNPETPTAAPYAEALLRGSHPFVGVVIPERGLGGRSFLRSLQDYGWQFFWMRIKEMLRARIRFWLKRTSLFPVQKTYLSTEEFLLDHPLPLLKPRSLREPTFLKELRNWQPDLILVSTLSHKVPPDLLTLPRHGCINLHAGLLPDERGPAGPFWALYYDQAKTGVTFHRMTEQFDRGEILFQEEVPVFLSDTESSLSQRIAQTGAESLCRFLDDLEKGALRPRPQTNGEFRRRPHRRHRKELHAKMSRRASRWGPFRKMYPVTATPIPFSDFSSFFRKGGGEEFEAALGRWAGRRFALTTGSGKGALYLILKEWVKRSARREVILPAYTDAGLVLSIQKAGCTARLCDVSLDDFGFSLDGLRKSISEKTLAVVWVEMFGLSGPSEEAFSLLKREGILVVEDCAQSFGGGYRGKRFGSFGDASFLSLGRGKNLPTFWGGAILTDDAPLAEALKKECRDLPHPFRDRATAPFFLLGQSTVVHPWIYGALREFLFPLRSRSVPTEIRLSSLTDAQAKIGLSLLTRLEELTRERGKNGSLWRIQLETIRGIRLPRPTDPDGAAYPQFPILFEEISKRTKAQEILKGVGIESSVFYPHAVDGPFPALGDQGHFPNAQWIAQRILTVPVHPFLDEERICLAARSLREGLG